MGNILVKITNVCNLECPYCCDGSDANGLHGNIMDADFLNKINTADSVTLTGGNPMSHSDLMPFLYIMKSFNVPVNIVVHQKHFMDDVTLFQILQEHSLVSAVYVTVCVPDDKFVEAVNSVPNCFPQLILGLAYPAYIKKLFGHDMSVRFLGYRRNNRGNSYYVRNADIRIKMDASVQWVKQNINLINDNMLHIMYDRLATEQLEFHIDELAECLYEDILIKDYDEFYDLSVTQIERVCYDESNDKP